MDFRGLVTFVQVAESGSFTRAAEILGYAQPTVSFQIKQLEKELGVQLFERIGHTVQLTDSGRNALVYAQHICRISQEMVHGTGEKREAKGTIRLVMSDSLCSPLVARRFLEFRRDYPQVSLNVVTAGTDEMYRMLDHNEADIVCTLDNHLYNTSYVIAAEEKIEASFVCCAAHPLARAGEVRITDLLEEPFLLTEKGMSYRRLMDEILAKSYHEIHPVLEMGNADLICELVGQGMGLSFLPDFVTERAVHGGLVVRLNVPECRVDLWKQLLYHRDKWLSPAMEAVIGHLSGIGLCGSEHLG